MPIASNYSSKVLLNLQKLPSLTKIYNVMNNEAGVKESTEGNMVNQQAKSAPSQEAPEAERRVSVKARKMNTKLKGFVLK